MEYEQCIQLLVAADIILLFRFLESQAYDYWLQQRAYSLFRPIREERLNQFEKNIIEKLKELVEINYFHEKKIISQIMTYLLRFLSKMEDLDQILTNQNKIQDNLTKYVPIFFYQDKYFYQNAIQQEKNDQKHWFIEMSYVQASYDWALIKTFSKYFFIKIPFINCFRSIADTPEKSTIPIKLSTYMSTLRNICLSNSNYELKHLILQKTSIERDRAPVFYFERLKLHFDGNQGAQSQNKSSIAQANMNEENQAANNGQKNIRKLQNEIQNSKNFMFTQAFEQIRDIECGLLRPNQPRGADPHLSFEVYFKGEDVVGIGGLYRQFFQ